MAKQEGRGSLMGLKTTLPNLQKVPAIHTAPEVAQRVLSNKEDQIASAEEPGGRKDVSTYVTPSAPEGGTELHRRREPTILLNAKLPIGLHTRLKRTAQFNDVTMTDILIQALEIELNSGRYAAPPEAWGAR